jgi:hypothetical protein
MARASGRAATMRRENMLEVCEYASGMLPEVSVRCGVNAGVLGVAVCSVVVAMSAGAAPGQPRLGEVGPLLM